MSIDRRELIRNSSLILAGTAVPAWPARALEAQASLPPFYEEIEQRTFRFFFETTNPANGLAPDRWPTPSFSSIAAV
ncbi:MAG TPA: Tat pathway signal protein, partial [Sphingomicrobium sp.]|nr:Tat pathway signal protein [Sphingomicrobium sp.]